MNIPLNGTKNRPQISPIFADFSEVSRAKPKPEETRHLPFVTFVRGIS